MPITQVEGVDCVILPSTFPADKRDSVPIYIKAPYAQVTSSGYREAAGPSQIPFGLGNNTKQDLTADAVTFTSTSPDGADVLSRTVKIIIEQPAVLCEVCGKEHAAGACQNDNAAISLWIDNCGTDKSDFTQHIEHSTPIVTEAGKDYLQLPPEITNRASQTVYVSAPAATVTLNGQTLQRGENTGVNLSKDGKTTLTSGVVTREITIEQPSANASGITVWVDGSAEGDSFSPHSVDAVKMRTGKDGSNYLFLPSNIKRSDATLYLAAPAVAVTMNGNALIRGRNDHVDLSADTLTFTSGGKTQAVKVLQSANIGAMFLTTESGSMSAVHANKDHREPGGLIIVDETGKTEYSDELLEIKGRGNTTWAMGKKPYQIKINKTNLFGMGKAKTWILLANAYDNALQRNLLVYNMGLDMGMEYSPECTPVDLYANNVYLGSYLLSEKVQIGSTRIPINDLEDANAEVNEPNYLDTICQQGATKWEKNARRYFNVPNEPEDITGGYLLEMESNGRYLAEPSGFVTSRGETIVSKSPEYASKAEMDYISALLQEFEDAIFSPDGKSPVTGRSFTEIADIDSLINVYLFGEYSLNVDAFASSTFIYKPEDKNGVYSPLKFDVLWDFDRSFGYDSRAGCNVNTLLIAQYKANYCFGLEWIQQLYCQKEFCERLKELLPPFMARMEAALGSGPNTLDAYEQMLRDSANMNFKIWNVTDNVGGTGGNSWSSVNTYLRNFMITRNGNFAQLVQNKLAQSVPLEGSGTLEDPYQVNNQADFQKMLGGGYTAGAWFRQTQDITLTGDVKPSVLFTYHYDGSGYQINCSNIHVSNLDAPSSGGGLFGGQISGGIIMNVHLTGKLTHVTKYADAFTNNFLEQSALVNCATSLEVAAVAGGQVSALVWHAGTNGKTKSAINNVYTTNVSSMAVIGDNTMGNSVENVYGVGRTDAPKVSGVVNRVSIDAAIMNSGRASAAAAATAKTGVQISEDDLCAWIGATNPTMAHKSGAQKENYGLLDVVLEKSADDDSTAIVAEMGAVSLTDLSGQPITSVRENDTVRLTAQANDGFRFLGWYQKARARGTGLLSEEPTLTLTIREASEVIALFESAETVNITAPRLSNLVLEDAGKSKLIQDSGANDDGFSSDCADYKIYLLPGQNAISFRPYLQYSRNPERVDTVTVNGKPILLTQEAVYGQACTYSGLAQIDALTDGQKIPITVANADGGSNTYAVTVRRVPENPQIYLQADNDANPKEYALAVSVGNTYFNAAELEISLRDALTGFTTSGHGSLASGDYTLDHTVIRTPENSIVEVCAATYDAAAKKLRLLLQTKDTKAHDTTDRTLLATLYFNAEDAGLSSEALLSSIQVAEDAVLGDVRFLPLTNQSFELVTVDAPDTGSVVGAVNSLLPREILQNRVQINLLNRDNISQQTARTDLSGAFSLRLPDAGQAYTLIIELPGYLQARRTVAPGVQVLGAIALRAGDLDGNGIVNSLDREALLTLLYQSSEAGAAGDFNGDGKINGMDLSYLLANIGQAA